MDESGRERSRVVNVSVVLCTRNGGPRIAPTLASIRASMDDAAEVGLSAELVAVDNASTDDTRRILLAAATADSRVRVVSASQPGLSRARNRGVRVAAGSAILFTDDDVVVPPHWVRRMSGPLLRGEADLVGGAVTIAEDLRRDWLTDELASAYYAYVPDPPVVGREFAGANMGASAAVLAAVPFDELLGTREYPGADDVVFRADVLAAGYRQQAVAGAAVEHHFDPARLEPRRILDQARKYGRCEAYIARHLRGDRPPALPEVAKAVVRSAQLVVLGARNRTGDPDARVLRTAWQTAYHRQMVASRHETRRPVSPVSTAIDD